MIILAVFLILWYYNLLLTRFNLYISFPLLLKIFLSFMIQYPSTNIWNYLDSRLRKISNIYFCLFQSIALIHIFILPIITILTTASWFLFFPICCYLTPILFLTSFSKSFLWQPSSSLPFICFINDLKLLIFLTGTLCIIYFYPLLATFPIT